MGLMSRDEVVALLQELAERMNGTEPAGIRVVGGAAISILFDGRHSTRDIDAALIPEAAMKAAAADIARQRGLPESWLSDASIAYLPMGRQDWIEVFTRGTVSVSVAAPDMLLAMKMRRARGLRDQQDIELLLDAMQPRSVSEVIEVFDRYFPQDDMRSKPSRESSTGSTDVARWDSRARV